MNKKKEIKESKNNLFSFKTSEENLAYGIIKDCQTTIKNAKKGILTKTKKEVIKEEIEWLMSDIDGFPHSTVSFKDCCDILGVNHKKQRIKILDTIAHLNITI